jgi:CheY-like chemotaxis protein
MPKTLLLADDSVTIQKVVGISFANEDVVLLTVDNGEDAIARAREARPDLVLADILMPGKDGYEVCEAIKSDPELRHVPVLLLSGTFENFDEERAQRVGADGHITKPFEAQALVDQVNELLARSSVPAPPSDAASDATLLVGEPEPTGSREAYDFFDEEMAQTAPSPPAAPTVVLSDEDEFGLGGEGLELEAAVEEELGHTAQSARPLAAAAPEAPRPRRSDKVTDVDLQETVLFDDESAAAPSPAARSEAERSQPLAQAPTPSLRSSPLGYEETFDFSFDAPEDAAAGRGRPSPAATRLEAPPAEELAEVAPPPREDRFEPRLEAPFAPPPLPDPGEARPRFAAPTPPPIPVTEMPAAPSAAMPAGSSAKPGEQRIAVTSSGELSGAMRQQLHETLEKVAWEAFGDLSERIVREALERVEAVAWEVIPQMAEVLIREEIRRLKDGE